MNAVRYSSISEFLRSISEKYRSQSALAYYRNQAWDLSSFAGTTDDIAKVTRFLRESGVQAGDRVAVVSEPSDQSLKSLLAIMAVDAVAVPLDHKLPANELKPLIGHAQPKFILASEDFFTIAEDLQHASTECEGVVGMQALFAHIKEQPAAEIIESSKDIDSPAMITYTSGTSGQPKGVVTSVRSIMFQSANLAKICENEPSDVIVSILPFNHIYGFVVAMYTLALGAEFVGVHSLEPEELGRCFRDRKVTQMVCVPLFLKTVRAGIEKKLADKGERVHRLFQMYFKFGYRLPFMDLKKLIFAELHERFGGELKRFIVGGAALDPELYEFFAGLGMPVYQGYGLTETGPVIAVNTPIEDRKNSVGRPLQGVEVRIDQKEPGSHIGHILTRGPHIMNGYYKADALTSEVMTSDGWFRTGDLGYLDEEGYLFVTGRAKSMIVLESGKKVQPEEVETLLESSDLFEEVSVMAFPAQAGNDICGAVVRPKKDMTEIEALSEISRICSSLAYFKRPTEVVIRHEEFPKTSSMKVKRFELQAKVIQERQSPKAKSGRRSANQVG